MTTMSGRLQDGIQSRLRCKVSNEPCSAVILTEGLYCSCPNCEAANVIDGLVSDREQMREALEQIHQRSNESGTGVMALINTINDMNSIARAALASTKREDSA